MRRLLMHAGSRVQPITQYKRNFPNRPPPPLILHFRPPLSTTFHRRAMESMALLLERQVFRRATIVPRTCRTCRVRWQPIRNFAGALVRRQQTPAQQKPEVDDEISRLLDSTIGLDNGEPATPTNRTSYFASRSGQPPSSRFGLAADRTNQPRERSSVDDLLETLSPPTRHSRTNRHQTYGSNFSKMDTSQMLNPLGINAPANARDSKLPPPVPEKKLPMKLDASVGRRIYVDEKRGVDAARAFRSLETRCARNKVRRDFMRQRFHERPGLKRKRLRSERWRWRFKQNFTGVVKLVQQMAKQGW